MHASTPSLSNAAATWAGWAVTAVTAKFYRSQSDIPKSTSPRIGKNIHKPCSLGNDGVMCNRKERTCFFISLTIYHRTTAIEQQYFNDYDVE